jgi:hypothetical protein
VLCGLFGQVTPSKCDGDLEEVVEEECENHANWKNHQSTYLEENEILEDTMEEEYQLVSCTCLNHFETRIIHLFTQPFLREGRYSGLYLQY